jgi:hypothetical protein
MEQQLHRGMKAKTIKGIIRKKIDAWLETIEDEELRKRVAKGSIVTGGCIASMLLGERVNDFDVYFDSRELTRDVAKYYVARFQPTTRRGIPCKISVDESKPDRIRVVIKSAGVASEEGTDKEYEYFEGRAAGDPAAGEYVGEIMQDQGEIHDTQEQTEQLAQDTEDDGRPKYRPVFMSTNAISLSHRIQLITRFYGNPEEIHANYDFVHCTCYWHDRELVLRPQALEALLAKELRYVGSRYPVTSVVRLRKFIKRGWSINAGHILKMCMQISELDLTKVEVLEDQLTGVDAAYFCEVMAKLRAKDPTKVDTAYLVEIIDRMF